MSPSAVHRAGTPAGGVRRDHRVPASVVAPERIGLTISGPGPAAVPVRQLPPVPRSCSTSIVGMIEGAHHVTGDDCFVLKVRRSGP